MPAPGSQLAEYLTGGHFAFLLGLEPSELIHDNVDAVTEQSLRKFWRDHGQDQPSHWSEVPAVPVAMVPAYLGERRPTQDEVAEDPDSRGGDDPHDVVRRWKDEQAERFRKRKAERDERQAATMALQSHGVNPFGEHTPQEVQRVLVDASLADLSAAIVRGWLDLNTLARAAGRRAELTITSAKLVTFGVPLALIATMRAADNAARAEAARALDEARQIDLNAARMAAKRAEAEAEAEVGLERVHKSVITDPSCYRRMPEIPTLLGNGVLHGDTSAYLVGAPGVAKSTVAIGVAVAAALRIERYLGMRVEPGITLYLAGEGAGSFGERLAAAAIALGWSEGDPLAAMAGRLIIVPDRLDLSTDTATAVLEALVREHRPSLIICDTFAQFRGADADENSAADMGRVIANITKIRQAGGGATWLSLHHPTGATVTKYTGAAPPVIKPRGSTALIGEADTVLYLHADSDNNRVLWVEKSRHGRDHYAAAFGKLETRSIPPDLLPARSDGTLRSGVCMVAVDLLDIATAAPQSPTVRRAAALQPLLLSEVCAAILKNKPLSASLSNTAGKVVVRRVAEGIEGRVPATEVMRQAEALCAAGVLTTAAFQALPHDRRGSAQVTGDYLRPADVYPGAAAASITSDHWEADAVPALRHLGIETAAASLAVADPGGVAR